MHKGKGPRMREEHTNRKLTASVSEAGGPREAAGCHEGSGKWGVHTEGAQRRAFLVVRASRGRNSGYM